MYITYSPNIQICSIFTNLWIYIVDSIDSINTIKQVQTVQRSEASEKQGNNKHTYRKSENRRAE